MFIGAGSSVIPSDNDALTFLPTSLTPPNNIIITTENTSTAGDMKNPADYYIGLGLAVSSSIFIGSSFILKKQALVRLASGGIRAGDGGFGYLKDWVWWGGMLLLAFGEIANFVAYAFAPATLVTPLGALSVLVTAVLSSRFLNQHLNLPGKVGCFVCISGSTMIVIHAPKEQEITSIAVLGEKLLDPVFMTYAILVVIANGALIFYVSPRYGHRNPLVYVAISGSIGSLSVMWCKAIGVAIKSTLTGQHNEFTNWLTYLILLLLVLCISVQMNFLNKALDVFHTGVVTPLLYVFFTTCTLTASTILFKEWRSLDPLDILGILTGFLTIIAAIFLLQALKDLDIQLLHLRVPLMKEEEEAEAAAGIESDQGYHDAMGDRQPDQSASCLGATRNPVRSYAALEASDSSAFPDASSTMRLLNVTQSHDDEREEDRRFAVHGNYSSSSKHNGRYTRLEQNSTMNGVS